MNNIKTFKTKYILVLLLVLGSFGMIFKGLLDFTASVEPEVIFEQTELSTILDDQNRATMKMTLKVKADLVPEEGIKSGRFSFAYDNDAVFPVEINTNNEILAGTGRYTGSATNPISEAVMTSGDLNAENTKYISKKGEGKFHYIYFEYEFNTPNMEKDENDYYVIATMKFKTFAPNASEFHIKTFDYDNNYKTYIREAKGGMDFITGTADSISNSYYYGEQPADYIENPQPITLPLNRKYDNCEAYPVRALSVTRATEGDLDSFYVPKSIPEEEPVMTAIPYRYNISKKEGYGYDNEMGSMGPSDIKWRFVSGTENDRVEIDPPKGIKLVENETPYTGEDGTTIRYGQILIDRTAERGDVYIEPYYYGKSGHVQILTIKKEIEEGQEIRFVEDINKIDLVNPEIFGKGVKFTAHWYDQYAKPMGNGVIMTQEGDYEGLEIVPNGHNSYYLKAKKGYDLNGIEAGTFTIRAGINEDPLEDVIKHIQIVKAEPVLTTLDFKYGTEQSVDIPSITEPAKTIKPDIAPKDQYGKYIAPTNQKWTMTPATIEGIEFNTSTGEITANPGASENEDVIIKLEATAGAGDTMTATNHIGILQSYKTVTTVKIEPIEPITTPKTGSIRVPIKTSSYDQYGKPYDEGILYEIKSKSALPKGVSLVLNNMKNGYELLIDNKVEQTTKIVVYLVFGIKNIEKEVDILRDISVLTDIKSVNYKEIGERIIPSKGSNAYVSQTPTIAVVDQYNRDITQDEGFDISWALEGNTDDKIKINQKTGIITIEPCALNQSIKIRPTINYKEVQQNKVLSAFTVKRQPDNAIKRYIKEKNIDYPLYIEGEISTIQFKPYIETQYGDEKEVTLGLENNWELLSYEPSNSNIEMHKKTGIIKLINGIELTKIKVRFIYQSVYSEEQEITINRQPATLGSIVIDAACYKDTVPTPTEGVETRQMTAKARDQYGIMRQDKILWTLAKADTGVSINEETGIVSIGNTCKVTSVNVIAKNGNSTVFSKPVTLRLERQISKISDVKIPTSFLQSNSNHELIQKDREIRLNSGTGYQPVLITQRARFYNQYDEPMDTPSDAKWEIKIYDSKGQLATSTYITNNQAVDKDTIESITTINAEIKDDYTIRMRVYSPKYHGIEKTEEYKVIKKAVVRAEIVPKDSSDTDTGIIIKQYMINPRQYTVKFYDQYNGIVWEPKDQPDYDIKNHWKIEKANPDPNPYGISFVGGSRLIDSCSIDFTVSKITKDETIKLHYEFEGTHSKNSGANKIVTDANIKIIKLRPVTANLVVDNPGEVKVKDEVETTRIVDIIFKDQENKQIIPKKVKWTLTNTDGSPYTNDDITIDKNTNKDRVKLTFKYAIPKDINVVLHVEDNTDGSIVMAEQTFAIKKSKVTKLIAVEHNNELIKIDPVVDYNNKRDYTMQVYDQFEEPVKAPTGGTWKIYESGTNTEYVGNKIKVTTKAVDKKIIGTLIFDKTLDQPQEGKIDIEYTYTDGISARFNNIRYVKCYPWYILFDEIPPTNEIVVSDVQSGGRTYKIKFRDQWHANIGVPPGVRWELRQKNSEEPFIAEGLSIKRGANDSMGELVIGKNLRLSCEFDVCALYTRSDNTVAMLKAPTKIVKLVQTRVEVKPPIPLSDIHIKAGESQERIYEVTFFDQNNHTILTPSDFEWKIYKKDLLGNRLPVDANDDITIEKQGAPNYSGKLMIGGNIADDKEIIIEVIYTHPYTGKTMTASYTQKIMKLAPKTLEIKADGDDRITIYHGINQTRTFSLIFKDQFGGLILPPEKLKLSLVRKSNGAVYDTEHIKLKTIDNYNKVQLDMSYLQAEDIELGVKVDFSGKYEISEKHYVSIVKINPERMEMSIEGKPDIIVGVSKEEEIIFKTILYDQYNCEMLPPYGYIWSIENEDGTPYIDRNLNEPGLKIEATDDATIGKLSIGKNFRGTSKLQIRAKVKGHEDITEIVPIKITKRTIEEEEVQRSKEEQLLLDICNPDIKVAEIRMENNESQLGADVFKRLQKCPGKTIKIISTGYTWEFKGSDIKRAIPLNTKLITRYSDIKNYNNNSGEHITMLNIDFDHHGDLPGMASIKIKADEKMNKDNLMFYYYNKKTNAIEYLETLVIDKDGYINIKRDQCSSYFVINGKIPYEYKDVVNAPWARDSIVRFTASSILTGYGDKTFKPMQTITRAELAQIVCKTFDYAVKEENLVEFKDVDNKKWYATSINALASNKIVGGYEDKTFRPHEQARGSDLINMLNRVIKDKNIKIKEEMLINRKMLITRAVTVVMVENIVNQMGD